MMKDIKRKVLGRIALLCMSLLIMAYAYVWYSTLVISPGFYKNIIKAVADKDITMSRGYDVKVEIVKINIDKLWLVPVTENTKAIDLNKKLLKLNGYRAVRVECVPKVDSIVGNLELYINPFTKQIFGARPRY